MTEEEKERAISEIEIKISALIIARRKLRKRRDTVPVLTPQEKLAIKKEMALIDMKIDDLEDLIDAFEASQASLEPPSKGKITKMKKKVKAIANIRASEATTIQIMAAVVEVSGSLQQNSGSQS